MTLILAGDNDVGGDDDDDDDDDDDGGSRQKVSVDIRLGLITFRTNYDLLEVKFIYRSKLRQ